MTRLDSFSVSVYGGRCTALVYVVLGRCHGNGDTLQVTACLTSGPLDEDGAMDVYGEIDMWYDTAHSFSGSGVNKIEYKYSGMTRKYQCIDASERNVVFETIQVNYDYDMYRNLARDKGVGVPMIHSHEPEYEVVVARILGRMAFSDTPRIELN